MKNIAIIFSVVLLAVACNNASQESRSNKYLDRAEAVTEETPVPNQTDVTKMIREANLRFRVKEVQQATSVLEKMAVAHGGYVARSMYDIRESETIIKKISTDSSQEIKKLYQSNNMVVFVLNTQLDTFLDKVKTLVDHLEYRHITAFDNHIEESPEPKLNNRPADFASPNNWLTANKKKYSKITMYFYQTPVIKKWTIPNPDSFEVARGGFWDDFASSVKSGWRGTTMFFNYMVSFWPLAFLTLVLYIVIRRKRKKAGWKSFFRKD